MWLHLGGSPCPAPSGKPATMLWAFLRRHLHGEGLRSPQMDRRGPAGCHVCELRPAQVGPGRPQPHCSPESPGGPAPPPPVALGLSSTSCGRMSAAAARNGGVIRYTFPDNTFQRVKSKFPLGSHRPVTVWPPLSRPQPGRPTSIHEAATAWEPAPPHAAWQILLGLHGCCQVTSDITSPCDPPSGQS